MAKRIILASSSPRRQELLRDCGLEFEVHVSGAVEERLPGESPQQMAERLAVLKASGIAARFPDAWVIGADTDVCVDGVILGKPSDAADAFVMLKRIQGRQHS
ncbi:MAG: Maf family protein, partial [Oligoflexia bacterium]|nr:Maf family protein [Oligoflexia bacterium]